jgi:hypothetical protein
MPISHWHEMDEGVILDVREPFINDTKVFHRSGTLGRKHAR